MECSILDRFKSVYLPQKWKNKRKKQVKNSLNGTSI